MYSLRTHTLKFRKTDSEDMWPKIVTITSKLKSTGWLDWKLSKVNCSGSECGHFWPHVVKTKMCLTIGSFILMQVVFWVYEKNKWRNYLQFPTCFRGLVDRRVGCKAKGPRFKTYLGSIKKLNFYRNFTFFSTFSQNENSPYKTASPQTNFGLYNIGSEMPTFRARAIYFWQLSTAFSFDFLSK